ncbi:SMO-like protein [Mya arenaria]|uniref:SMO-like protein n=1 Tax=Mya arenaria TaxID=6604 RepID=A0ABY7F692_MYAAR|nr:SMO-like protein [Mya arenaria]
MWGQYKTMSSYRVKGHGLPNTQKLTVVFIVAFIMSPHGIILTASVPCYMNDTSSCVPVEVTECLTGEVTFNYTSLVYTNGSLSQVEIQTQLDAWSHLKAVPECWSIIQPFLCSVYLPRCDQGESTGVERPNRELCERVRSPCQVIITAGGQWPSFLDCEQDFYAENCGPTFYETSKFTTDGECVAPLISTGVEENWYGGMQGCGMQCEDPLYTPNEHKGVFILVAVVASLCITFVLDWKVGRKYPAVILFYINGCFLVATLGWMVQLMAGEGVTCRKDGTIRKNEPLIGYSARRPVKEDGLFPHHQLVSAARSHHHLSVYICRELLMPTPSAGFVSLVLPNSGCGWGLKTLIKVRKDSPPFIGAKATSKIHDTIIRLGVFILLTCRSNISVSQIIEGTVSTSCEIESRPSVVAVAVHIITFFAASLVFSSWSWNKASINRHKSDSSDISKASANGVCVNVNNRKHFPMQSVGSSNNISDSILTKNTDSISEIDLPQTKPVLPDFSIFTAKAALLPTKTGEKGDNSNTNGNSTLKGANPSPSGSFRRGRRREVKLEMTETSFYQEDDENIEMGGNQVINCEENCHETGEVKGNLKELGPLVNEIFEQARASSGNGRSSTQGQRDPMGSSRLGSASSRGSRGSRGSQSKTRDFKYANTKVSLPPEVPRNEGDKTARKRPFSGDYILTSQRNSAKRDESTRKSQSQPNSRVSSATDGHKRQIGHNGNENTDEFGGKNISYSPRPYTNPFRKNRDPTEGDVLGDDPDVADSPVNVSVENTVIGTSDKCNAQPNVNVLNIEQEQIESVLLKRPYTNPYRRHRDADNDDDNFEEGCELNGDCLGKPGQMNVSVEVHKEAGSSEETVNILNVEAEHCHHCGAHKHAAGTVNVLDIAAEQMYGSGDYAQVVKDVDVDMGTKKRPVINVDVLNVEAEQSDHEKLKNVMKVSETECRNDDLSIIGSELVVNDNTNGKNRGKEVKSVGVVKTKTKMPKMKNEKGHRANPVVMESYIGEQGTDILEKEQDNKDINKNKGKGKATEENIIASPREIKTLAIETERNPINIAKEIVLKEECDDFDSEYDDVSTDNLTDTYTYTDDDLTEVSSLPC